MIKSIISRILVVLAMSVVLVSCKSVSPEQRADRIVKYLDINLKLTEEQNVELAEVKRVILEARHRRVQERQAKQADLTHQLLSPRLDENAIISRIQERQGALLLEAPEVVSKLVAFHASLSAEQKQRLVNLLDELRARAQLF